MRRVVLVLRVRFKSRAQRRIALFLRQACRAAIFVRHVRDFRFRSACLWKYPSPHLV
jgi:hypothetical protein